MNTTLTIDMTHLPNSIPLGRCGENHTVICFDCTSYLETYGEGSAALLFQPAQGSMHPVVVEQTGALVTWRAQRIRHRRIRLRIVRAELVCR